MQKLPRTVVVDLTPVLPGGENGGAKIFVLELLAQLSQLDQQTRFILLTQHTSHDELAFLDRPNMERLMVIGATAAQSMRPRLVRLALKVLPHLPNRVRRRVSALGHRINSAIKRGSSTTLLGDLQADLLYCPFTAPLYAQPGVPTVCTIHDLQYKTHPGFFEPEDVANRDRAFMTACKQATMLAAVSNYSRNSAILHGHVDPEHIRTIYLRLAERVQKAEDDPVPLLSRLGLTTGHYLIYPANFWRHKNHEMLFTAFGMACANGLATDIKMVCTGAPGARQIWLEQAAAAMGLADRIVFPGFIPTHEFRMLMTHSRAVIFPSLYEGFGLPVIEAMAAGIPVACSNITSLPEIADGAALLFDPRIPSQIANAIITISADSALSAQLSQAGSVRAAEFADSRRMALEYLDLFDQAIRHRTKSSDYIQAKTP
jgi:glycosyltransferase involved in cell wall biosynthesis